MEEHAVVLERERPLGLGAGQSRDPLGELRMAIRGDES
jgi:hypothetical protein